MARAKRDQDLFDKLRAGGLRKRVARTIADASSKAQGGRAAAPKAARDALAELRGVVGDLEKRLGGGQTKRSASAQKAARTRQRNARQRSQSAKKAAVTRKRAKGS